MRPAAFALEDFGDPASGRRSASERKRDAELAEARGAAHAEGYAEGFAAATEKAATEERAAIGALLELARDLDLARAGARAEAIAALGPVVEALARVAAPRAAAAGLAGELAAAVAARLEAAPAARLQARVAPEVAASVAERLGDGLEVATDAALGPTEARLDWPGGGLRFDADAAASAALEAITRHFGAAADPREAAAEPAPPAPPDGDRTEDLKDVG